MSLALVPRPAPFAPSARANRSAAAVQFSNASLIQMANVRSHAQVMSMSVDETSPEHCDPCTKHGDDMERESLSQPLVNFLADVMRSEEYSQAPTSGDQVASSQQPSPELLVTLGIKVRDFAYENTLPAIVPVPRVPRQVQPAAPRTLKRLQREWDDKEGPLHCHSPPPARTGPKHPARSLERKPTEPLQEPAVQQARTLERRVVRRLCSTIAPPPRTRVSASPPTSPLTPPLSHNIASQEPEFVQTPSAFPFVVHVNDTSMIPASRFDSDSHHPVLYTRFTLDSRSSSPAPSPPRCASPAPLMSPFLEVPTLIKESGADPRVSKRRSRRIVGTTPPNRYQLRERPLPSSRVSTLSRCSHQASSTRKSRRTRRVL